MFKFAEKDENKKFKSAYLMTNPKDLNRFSMISHLLFCMDKFNVNREKALELSDKETNFAKAYLIMSGNKNALAQTNFQNMK